MVPACANTAATTIVTYTSDAFRQRRSPGGIAHSVAAMNGATIQPCPRSHAPAPRRGLLSLASGKALKRKTLTLAPEGALSFSATSLKFSEVMNVVRAITTATDVSRSLEGFLQIARGNLGFDIERDLLQNLDDDVAFAMMSPEISGGNPLTAGAGGISLILSMKDPDAIGMVVDKILSIVDMMLQRVLGSGGDNSDLAECSTEQFSCAAGFGDEFVFTNQDRAHWRAEPLGKTNADRVKAAPHVPW